MEHRVNDAVNSARRHFLDRTQRSSKEASSGNATVRAGGEAVHEIGVRPRLGKENHVRPRGLVMKLLRQFQDDLIRQVQIDQHDLRPRGRDGRVVPAAVVAQRLGQKTSVI